MGSLASSVGSNSDQEQCCRKIDQVLSSGQEEPSIFCRPRAGDRAEMEFHTLTASCRRLHFDLNANVRDLIYVFGDSRGIDCLSAFPEAIRAAYPLAKVQLGNVQLGTCCVELRQSDRLPRGHQRY